VTDPDSGESLDSHEIHRILNVYVSYETNLHEYDLVSTRQSDSRPVNGLHWAGASGPSNILPKGPCINWVPPIIKLQHATRLQMY